MVTIRSEREGSSDFNSSVYAEVAHSLCAEAIETIKMQIADNTVLIDPGFVASIGKGPTWLNRIGNEDLNWRILQELNLGGTA